MRNTKLYAAMLMFSMANSAHALGLGELSIESSLFQPLRADVEIYGWDKVTLENLRATLASQNAFLRNNIERPFFLRDLKMEVVRTGNNDAVVRITSTQPIREPMLDVLIDVQWPGGHLQKQYTLFLDPPVTAQTLAREQRTAPATTPTATAAAPAPTPTTQPAVSATAVAAAPEVQPATARAPEPAPAAKPAVPASYMVRRGDTLSRIADRFKAPLGVTRDQLMLAIQDANRRAFIGGNINGLMGGMELQIPDAQTVAALPPEEATVLVEQQHQAWLDRNTPQPAPAPTETEVAKAEQETTGLRLVPTVQEPETQAQPGAEASEAERELTALETELMETRQLLFEREAELDVMRSRMAVYDAELQELKAQLAEMRNEAMAQAPVQVAAEPPAASTPPIDIRTLLITLFAVLGGFGLFSIVYRRLTTRAQTAEQPAVHMTPLPLEIDKSLQALNEAEREAEPEEEEEEAVEAPAAEPVQQFTLRDKAEVDRDSPTEVREIMADPHPGAETADRMLVEADVLIQFGFYQRGKDLLDEALLSDPGNSQYRLKLMELCQVMEDSQGFRDHAELLRQRITPDDEMWTAAADMTEAMFPGDPLFSADDYVAQEVVVGGEPTPGTAASWDPQSTQEIPKVSDGEGEFVNLDEVLEPPAEEAKAQPGDWEFQAPADTTGERPVPADNAGATSEWLLSEDQLKSYEQAEEEEAEDDDDGGALMRGQVEAGDRFSGRDDDYLVDADVDLDDDEELAKTTAWVTGNNPTQEGEVAEPGHGTQELPAARAKAESEEPDEPVEPGAVTGELNALVDMEGEAEEDEPPITHDWQPPAGAAGETQAFPTGEVDGVDSTTRDWQPPAGAGGDTQAFATGDGEQRSVTREWQSTKEAEDSDDDGEPPTAAREWQPPDKLHPPRPGGDTQAFPTAEHDIRAETNTREWQPPEELHPPSPGGDTQAFSTAEHEIKPVNQPKARQSRAKRKRRKRKSR